METKEQVLNAFRLELNKWLNHSVRGMKSGNPAYFQGKITLIHDLLGFIHDIDNQEEPDKSLEEEFSRIWDKELSGECDTEAAFKVARHFAEWQKEQMLKDAVDGRVFMSFAPGHNQMVMADVDLPTNTKVRVLVIKAEE